MPSPDEHWISTDNMHALLTISIICRHHVLVGSQLGRPSSETSTWTIWACIKPSSLSNSYPPLQINGNDLHCVTEFWYLGVILTQSLSWTRHISSICSKSQKILGLVFRHFYRHSSPETIIRLYTSLVRPILEYCSPVWSPSSSSQTIKLEFIQSFTIKLAYKFHLPPQPPIFTLSPPTELTHV